MGLRLLGQILLACLFVDHAQSQKCRPPVGWGKHLGGSLKRRGRLIKPLLRSISLATQQIDFTLERPKFSEPVQAIQRQIAGAVDIIVQIERMRDKVRRVTHDEDPWLQLRVSDTGSGIPEQDLPHVCDAFWRGDDSNAGKRHGIGLGLTIAKRVMENHGGSIVIKGGENGGTEVVMSIPQAEVTGP